MGRHGRHIVFTLARHAAISWRFSADARRTAFAREMRAAFEELGPTFIKLGQLISVRPDVFGPDLVFEMEKLRDAVPALPAEKIRQVIERELGPVARLFSEFDDRPIASASIAQVHRAVLVRDYRPVTGEVLAAGTPLAVKVVRPGVREAILTDVRELRSMFARLSRTRAFARYGLEGLLDEFSASLVSECDLRREAGVADRFAFDFRDDPLIVVPRTVWPLTSRHVLTMEYIEGWRVSDVTDAARAGIDGRALALHGADVFMRQVLVLGRFHADLHPANLFVTPEGRIAYLDFGITGRTRPQQRTAIAQVLAATVYGDADRALKYSAELGLVIDPARAGAVRARVAALMAETLGATPRDLRAFALGFLRLMHAEGVRVPVGYGLLVKALVTVEGVARALYPDVDIVEAAGPFATRLIARTMLEPARLAEKLPAAARAAIRELAG